MKRIGSLRLIKPVNVRKLVIQYAQFKTIGIVNGFIDIGSLNAFLLLWPTKDDRLLLLYSSIAYVLAVANSYIWNSRITFRESEKTGRRERGLFIVQAAISFLIHNAIFWLALNGLAHVFASQWLIDNGAKYLAMFSSSTASFFFMKGFVFRRNRT
ncbi:MAG TPA: GtrA family protein [Bacillales bacterium]|nr:GtrA family protein [Bacillales bacterium]